MKERIEEKERVREFGFARELVRRSGLSELLSRIDGGSFGTTSLNLEVLEAMAGAAATAVAAMRLPRLEPAGPVFFAYLFAAEALARLEALAASKRGQAPSGSLNPQQYRDIEAMKSPELLLPELLKDCRGFLIFYAEHRDPLLRLGKDSDALTCLASYFSLLLEALRKIGPQSLTLSLSTPKLKFEGWSYSSGEVADSDALLGVGLDDVVGNDDYVAAAKRLARDVAGFDPVKGLNPKRIRNQILFVLGSPGCGKTVTAHAVLRYFLDLCGGAGVPAKTRIIRRTDWASSYQNQSANRLLEIFKDEVFNSDSVVGVYWGDIDTAFSARGDSDMRQEEKANLGTLFGILDGTVGPKNGKWFLICDANTMHMDEAMISRLSQTPLEAKGPQTPENFVRLLRDIKLKGKERWLPISGPQWEGIGRRCVESGLSGRSVDAIAGRVLTAIEDFNEPEEYFSLSFEKKQEMISRLSIEIPAERLLGFISDHLRFEKAALEKSEEEKFSRRVEEIRLHLSASKAAMNDGP